MPLPVDLHTHSTASDGTLTPAELMRRAAAVGLRLIALTDHDTLQGLAEAGAEAAHLGMEFLPGVEVSVTWEEQTVHVLGLGVDPRDSALRDGLGRLQAYREQRAMEIGERLAGAGTPDAYQAALDLAGGDLVSRTHFARVLVQRGKAADLKQAFKNYLTRGRPGFVADRWASLEEAANWIRSAGGKPVVAHPARYRFTRTKLHRLLGEFVELGGVGLEVVSGTHSRDECFAMAQHARTFDLAASAGSDFHSPDQRWLPFGKLPDLPAGCRPLWNDWPLAA